MLRVLIVDDDPIEADALAAYLRSEGIEPTHVALVAAAIEELRTASAPDLVLLDLMLPDGAGLDVLRVCTQRGIPTVVLSAKDSETDKVVALELGADDYVVKPSTPREIVARVRSVLRRAQRADTNEPALAFGELQIARDSCTVTLAGKNVAVTPLEYRVLLALATRAGRTVSRSELLDEIGDAEIHERSLDRHVASLRRKIERDPKNPRFITTVHGSGYLFRAR